MPIPGRVSHEFLRRLECPVDVPQDFPSKNRSPISSGILPLSVAWKSFAGRQAKVNVYFFCCFRSFVCVLGFISISQFCPFLATFLLIRSPNCFVPMGMSRSICLGVFTTLRFYIAVRHQHIEVNGPWLNHGLLDVQGLRCGVFAVYRPRMFAGGWRTMGHDLPSGYVKIAIENDHLQWIFPLKMVIFHSLCQFTIG